MAASGAAMAAAGQAAAEMGSGIIGYIGQRSANRSNEAIARRANEFNAAQSAQQMAFQERMSNTAYQRSTQDLLAAGLNPMLAYTNGPASSPGGSSASATTGAPQQNAMGPISRGISSAADVYQRKLQLDQLQSQIAVNKASAAKISADAISSASDSEKRKAHGTVWHAVNNVLGYVTHSASDMIHKYVPHAKEISRRIASPGYRRDLYDVKPLF